MSSRVLLRNFPLSRLVGVVLLCLLASATQAQVCQPQPDTDGWELPYNGWRLTEQSVNQGDLKYDVFWGHAVRPIPRRGRSPLYEFRRLPGVRFDSIEPIDLGGGVMGFTASDHGCARLFDARGTPYPLPAADEFAPIALDANAPATGLEANPPDPHQILYHLKVGEGYLFALFKRGRLIHTAPRLYSRSYSLSSALGNTCLPAHLSDVVDLSDPTLAKHGLIDLRTLKEVLPLQWEAVNGLCVNANGKTRVLYLMAAQGKRISLFNVKAEPIPLDGIVSLEAKSEWFPNSPGKDAADRAVILLRKEGEAGCQLLDWQLQPLIPQQISAQDGRCNLPRNIMANQYVFAADAHMAHAYRVEPQGYLHWMGSAPGKLEGGYDSTGVMLMQTSAGGTPVYRIYNASGERTTPDDYAEIRPLGCGVIWVKRDGKWLNLGRDGQVSTRLGFPFSC